jgi:hypothetical protein
MNEDQPLDLGAVIAELEAKKAVIDNAIQALRALSPVGADGAVGSILGSTVLPASGGGGRIIDPDKIPADAFFGMRSIADAAKKYLGLVKRKQTTKQIVEALERGGFPHQSKSFYSTVYTALQREEEREGGEIARIGSEWAMASWYPGRARRPKETEAKRPKKKAAKGAKSSPKSSPQASPKALVAALFPEKKEA